MSIKLREFFIRMITATYMGLLVQLSATAESVQYHGARSDEQRLITDLLRFNVNHTPARPLVNSSTAVNVTMGITITQIIKLNEKEGTLTMQMWTYLGWYDDFLEFDENEYGGLTSVNLSPKQVWIPDIMLFGCTSQDCSVSQSDSRLLNVDSTGFVNWAPSAIYTSSCRIEVDNFPFDTQTCFLKFGSWAYSAAQLQLHVANDEQYSNGVDLSEYISSIEWELRNVTSRKNNVIHTCCPEGFDDVTIKLTLKRKPGFYAYVLLLPSVVLSSMVLFLYWIPPGRPDRTTVGMSICSSFFLLLLVVVEKAPPAAETKLGTVLAIGQLLCGTLVLIIMCKFCAIHIVAAGFAVLNSVFVVNVSMRRHRMSSFTRKILVLKLHDVLCRCCRWTIGDRTVNVEMTASGHPTDDNTHTTAAKPRSPAEEWQIVAFIINISMFFLHLAMVLYTISYILPWH